VVFKVKLLIRSDVPERLSTSINEMLKELLDKLGGDYVKVGLNLIWSSTNNVLVKTMIRELGVATLTVPKLFEIQLVIEGTNATNVTEVSKVVITSLKKHDLLVTVAE